MVKKRRGGESKTRLLEYVKQHQKEGKMCPMKRTRDLPKRYCSSELKGSFVMIIVGIYWIIDTVGDQGFVYDFESSSLNHNFMFEPGLKSRKLKMKN